MVSKFQRKPFCLATQRDPQNDWTATQNRVNCTTVHSEIFSQTFFDFKRMVSHSISPKFSGKIPYVLSKPRICSLGSKDKTVLFLTGLSRSEKRTQNLNSGLKLKITTRKENWGKKMASGVFPENLRKIKRETNVL